MCSNKVLKTCFLALGLVLGGMAMAATDQTPKFDANSNQLVFVKRVGDSFYFKGVNDTSTNPRYQIVSAAYVDADAYPVAIYAKTLNQPQFSLQPVYVKSGYNATALQLRNTNPPSGSTADGLVTYSPNPDANPVRFSVSKEDGSNAYFTQVHIPSAIELERNNPNKKMEIGFSTNVDNFLLTGVDPDYSFVAGFEYLPPGLVAKTKSLQVTVSLTDSSQPFSTAYTPLYASTYQVNPYPLDDGASVELTGWVVFATDKASATYTKSSDKITQVKVLTH